MTTIDSNHTCQPEATVCAASSACAAKSAHAPNLAQIEEGITLVLKGLGEDVTRPGLVDTPSRVARACAEFLQPGFVSVEELFEKQFDVSCSDIVLVKDIPFSSLCEHHLLPFFGTAQIAYLPNSNGTVCGLSKLARALDACAARLQIQERLTRETAHVVMEGTHAQGVYVCLDAQHMCMSLRGAHKPGAITRTQFACGCFDDPAKKQGVMRLIFG